MRFPLVGSGQASPHSPAIPALLTRVRLISGIERGERNLVLVNVEKTARTLRLSLSEMFRSVKCQTPVVSIGEWWYELSPNRKLSRNGVPRT